MENPYKLEIGIFTPPLYSLAIELTNKILNRKDIIILLKDLINNNLIKIISKLKN